MEKYKFIKPYSAQVTVGGAVGVETKSFAIGDMYDGTPKNGSIRIRIAEHTALQTPEPSNTSYDEFLNVPREYLSLAFPTGLPGVDIFTGVIPKIAILIVIILVIAGILKLFKVF